MFTLTGGAILRRKLLSVNQDRYVCVQVTSKASRTLSAENNAALCTVRAGECIRCWMLIFNETRS